jgi:hypothetical protein
MALEEIESFPISRYHAGAAQRIARDVLAKIADPRLALATGPLTADLCECEALCECDREPAP